jgi:cytochrome P450
MSPTEKPGALAGPTGDFLGLRTLRRMQEDLLALVVSLAKEHGDAVGFRLGPIRVFQLTHPDATHEVLVAQHRAFRKPRQLTKVLGQWNGNGLVVNEGESWLRQRRLVHPAFKPQRLVSHVEAVARRTGPMRLRVFSGPPGPSRRRSASTRPPTSSPARPRRT